VKSHSAIVRQRAGMPASLQRADGRIPAIHKTKAEARAMRCRGRRPHGSEEARSTSTLTSRRDQRFQRSPRYSRAGASIGSEKPKNGSARFANPTCGGGREGSGRDQVHVESVQVCVCARARTRSHSVLARSLCTSQAPAAPGRSGGRRVPPNESLHQDGEDITETL